jgi:hypothetical protein
MKTPAMRHPTRKQGRLSRLRPAASLLRRAASRTPLSRGGPHGSRLGNRVGHALPRFGRR